MTSYAPIKREGDIPIVVIPLPTEPKRLNPGIPVPFIPRPIRIKEPAPVKK